MPVSPARAAAFDILLRVETADAYVSELLHSSRVATLSPPDHALATEIVMGVLRWRSVLDTQIAEHVSQALSKLDAEVITVLRMGVYQLLFLDRIPAHAAINESVELVKKARKRSAAGMVNAVLRKIKQSPLAAEAANNVASPSARLKAGPSRSLRGGSPRANLEYLQISSSDSRLQLEAQTPPMSSRAERDLSLAKDHVKSRACPERPTGGKESNGDLQLRADPRAPASPIACPEVQADQDLTRQPGAQTNSRSLDVGNRFASESISFARDDIFWAAHPEWLVRRWVQHFGVDATRKICAYNQKAPNPLIRADASLAQELAREDIRLEPGRLLSSANVVAGGDVTRTQAFRGRRLVIQDEASQLVALLVGTGRYILDCCAAPGGKTRVIVEKNPDARVVAMELHPHRAKLLKRLVPLPNVHVVVADARTIPFSGTFDRVLVDAPCTGTGTLARNPEIKWRLNPDDISRLRAYQLEILLAAMKHLLPGGRLLYSTCSLEPEENESVVEEALKLDSGLRTLNVRDRLEALRLQGELVWGNIGSLLRGPYLRTLPGVHPCDGFFAALLERQL